jgi:predicted ATPase
LTAAAAERFTAVQLFVERASASLDGFSLTDADAPIVAQICRHLDGLPLAIELAAARIDMFGLRGLAAVLNEHGLLLSQGHRTAQPRHQSLLGALDCSGLPCSGATSPSRRRSRWRSAKASPSSRCTTAS